MRGTPSLRSRPSGLCRLIVSDPHLANVDCSYGQARNIVSLLSGLDQEFLQEEGDDLGVRKMARFLLFGFTPSVQLQTD